jgi:hypothetical protein
MFKYANYEHFVYPYLIFHLLYVFVFAKGSRAQPSGALNVSSLTINAGEEEESRIVLGGTDDAFVVALKSNGDFEIRSGETPSIKVTSEGDIMVYGKLKSTGSVAISEKLNFMGVDQWLLAVHEDFMAETAEGWSNTTTSTCGNPMKRLLGGYGVFAGGEVSKSFFELPAHKQIRVKANYHFIDAWGGETAYAKLDHRILWTDNLDQQASKVGIQICGASIPESKFAVPIDVVIPHETDSLTVAFGSTLSRPPTEQSWGISDFQIYIR